MRPTWRGAIELAGFPVPVVIYNRVKSRGGESFKTLGSDGKPVRQVYIESGEYAKLEKDPHTKVETIGRNDTHKGVAVADDKFVALPDEAVEAIKGAERSTVVEPASFVPREALPLELATGAFVVRPDEKVAGSAKAVSQLWNGLRYAALAYVTQVTMRAGSRDAIVALYARDDGLYAVALPFEQELTDTPEFEFDEDPSVGENFAKFVATSYEVKMTEEFDHSAYESTYRKVRQEAVEAALDGKSIPAPKKATPSSDGADLASILEDAVKAKPTKAKKTKAKKTATKKRASSKKKVGA